MKATELRIGNLIYGPTDREETVTSIISSTIIKSYPGKLIEADLEAEVEYCNGIAITEKWLVKCGFEDTTSYQDYHIRIADYSYLSINARGRPAQLRENPSIADHDVSAPCKYVHQLQNLYFALTGQELTISNP